MTLGRLALDKSLWKELALALELYFHSDIKLEKLSLFALPSELLEEIIKQRTTMKFHKNQRAKEKGKQEEHIRYKQQCSVLNLQSTLFLFDLTNFYFEGQALSNELVKRGKSKEKRSQNALVNLALLVDGDGFPIKSEVYQGNIGEPHTLEEILEKSGLLNIPKGELPFRPTLAMDRGIAIEENIKLIQKHNFPFTVIQRANKSSKFKDEFKSMNDFTAIKDVKGQTIQLKRIGNELLFVSEGKRLKKNAIYHKKKSKIKKELEALSKAFTNGRLQDPTKIQQRIGRIKGVNPGFDKYFSVKFTERKNGGKGKLSYQEKTKKNQFAGCYVIKHKDVGNDEETIWRIYSTLTGVESAFRSMKTDLGTRSIYHQGSERTKNHLFISILD